MILLAIDSRLNRYLIRAAIFSVVRVLVVRVLVAAGIKSPSKFRIQ